jgi:parallel beta-helix repeat protein
MKKATTLKVLLVVLILATPFIHFAQTEIPGGEIYGNWILDDAPFYISGDVVIPDGQTLIIDPGVEINFKGHYRFDIEGRLLAEGTSDAMITFTAETYQTGWNGLRFVDIAETNDTSKLVYCIIQYGFPTGVSDDDKSGGGVAVIGVDKLLIAQCEIKENRTTGGLNTGGGGILIRNASPHVTRNFIANNEVEGGHGGGIAISNNADPLVTNNILLSNEAFGGGGFVVSQSNPVLFNNTITGNFADHGGGVDFPYGTATFVNNIFYANYATDVGDEIHLGYEYTASFYNCIIEGGLAAFGQDHLSGCPDYAGTYESNIETDPMFLDIINDLNLDEYSPCIGAGVNVIEIDGTVYNAPLVDFYGNPRPNPSNSSPDIGAIESDLDVPTTSIEKIDYFVRSLNVFPNPSTEYATLSFQLEVAESVSLRIVDVMGKTISVADKGLMNPGLHEITVPSFLLSPGLYFLTLDAGGYTTSVKLIVEFDIN